MAPLLAVATSEPARKAAPAKKPSRSKKAATGDYEVGYCRPPPATRFDGSRAGPGRPRGSLSQDTLIKKHLTQLRPVAVEGRQTKMQVRELVLMVRVKEALSGNRHAADYLLTNAARLFDERADTAQQGGPASPADMDEHDRAILDALQTVLLAGARGEEGDDPADQYEPDDDQAPTKKGGRS